MKLLCIRLLFIEKGKVKKFVLSLLITTMLLFGGTANALLGGFAIGGGVGGFLPAVFL